MEQLLNSLLAVKRVREDSREAEMRGARRRLEEASRARDEARQLRAARDAQRAEEERELYAKVFARPVRLRDLDDLRDDVASLREQGRTDEEMVAQAEALRETRRGELDEATGTWHQAAQAREKFDGLVRAAREETAREQERLADLEMEEFTVRRPGGEAFTDETTAGGGESPALGEQAA